MLIDMVCISEFDMTKLRTPTLVRPNVAASHHGDCDLDQMLKKTDGLWTKWCDLRTKTEGNHGAYCMPFQRKGISGRFSHNPIPGYMIDVIR